ncbi:MAG TPA: amino acid permease [Symbiobacteriaceae bacterium]
MQQELRRDLGLLQATFTVVGIVIGSGIFALPAVVFAAARAPGLGVMAWTLGGLMSLAAALTLAELAAAMPRAGGTYVYLREAYGEWMAFLQGWATFLGYNPALQAALAMLFATYLSAVVPMSPGAQSVAGVAAIVGLTLINIWGVRFGGWVQVLSTAGKLIPIALLVLGGLVCMNPGNLAPVLPDQGVAQALAQSVLVILWAYDGWMNVGQLAEEIRNPHRNLPLALIGGLLLVTVVYSAFNAALVGVIPMDQLVALEKPVVPMAEMLFGTRGGMLITLGMVISMFGTLNGITMTGPRYYFAMARDRLFPGDRWVSQVHPRYGTPANSLLLCMAWAVVLFFTGTFEQLLNLVVFVAWFFYVLSMVGVFVLRHKRPDMERPYRVWGYPFVPLVGIGSGLWILWSSFSADPAVAILGLILTLSGLPVYWILRRRQE